MSHPKRRSFRAPATLAVAGLAAALLVPLGLATASPAAAVVGECPTGFVPAPKNPASPTNPDGNQSWTDDNVAVFAGGDFIADEGAAESEGLLVVMGDATFDKSSLGVFNVGWVGVGSQVAPTPGSVMLAVGGSLTLGPTTTLDVGSGARNDQGVLLGGSVQVGAGASPTYPSTQYELNNGSLETGMGAGAVSEWSSFQTQMNTNSAAWVGLADTGTVTSDGTVVTFDSTTAGSPQVFTITAAELDGIRDIRFTNMPADVPVIINVVGGDPIDLSTYNFSWNGTMGVDGLSSPLFGEVAQRLMWNFADTTSVTFGDGSQFLGSVLAPNADLDITASMNGRVYAGGDIHTHGAGNELHNYPWIGDADYECIVAGDAPAQGRAELTKVLTTDGVVASDRAFFGWLRCTGEGVEGDVLYREGFIRAGQTLPGTDLPVGADCVLFEDPDREVQEVEQDELPAGFMWAAPRWMVNGQVVDSPEFVVPGVDDPAVEVTVSNTLLARFSVEKIVSGPEGGYTGDRAFEITYTCDEEAYDDNGEMLGAGSQTGTMLLGAGGTAVSPWFPIGTQCQISEQTPATQAGDFATEHFEWLAPTITPATLTVGQDDQPVVESTVTNTYRSTTGSFTIDKVVENPSGLTFTDAFTGDWTCTLGEQTQSGTWTTSSTASPVVVNDIPVGAQCTVTEDSAAAVTGGTWDAPVITPATFTISGESAVAVTVTNTLRAATTANPGTSLPTTGGTVPVWAIVVGGGLLVAGAAVVVIALVRRRRS